MMKFVFSALIVISVIIGIINGNIDKVSDMALNSGKETIELLIVLIGAMAVWGGMMRIADKSGITDKIAKLFKPLCRVLFKNLSPNSKAFKAITANITANLMGLGNAATPLGLEAMKELQKEDKTTNTASRNMIMFVVLNTASIQILPTTIATLRLEHGSKAPLEILPAILIVSLISLIVGITMVFLFDRKEL